MHYGLAATLVKAVEDFLRRAPRPCDDGSAAAAAEIRRVRAAYPETVVHPMSELPELAPGLPRRDLAPAPPTPPGSERLTWLKRAATWLAAGRPGRTGSSRRATRTGGTCRTSSGPSSPTWARPGFRLRERDRAKAKDLARRGARVLPRLLSEGPAVAERYRAEHGRLTSRANWARLYGHPA